MEVDLGLSRKMARDERRESEERSWAARVKKRGAAAGSDI